MNYREIDLQLRVQATGAAASDSIRSETFRGRSYTVVPVVGLVEGILQGLNAAEPEFAPASEFGKIPMSWNGRPITMNHPRRDGTLVSANEVDMLEEYSFGFLANSSLDDSRLKFEAWIDNEVVAEKGDEFQETLNRLNSGEDLVEVSTGLFCDVVTQGGVFNGQKYKKTWAHVVPDHLAFLSKGSVGACSVDAGCGAPRLNTENLIRLHQETGQETKVVTLQTAAPVNLGAPQEACCNACAKGDPCMPPDNNVTTNEGSDSNEANSNSQENNNAEGTSRGLDGGNQEGGDSGNPEDHAEQGSDQHLETERLPEQIAEELVTNQRSAEILDRLSANAVDSAITFENARQVAQTALRDHLNGAFVYVMAMTTDLCAYERYEEGVGFSTFALNYSVDRNGGVQFTGEPVPVNLLVRIVQREVSANEGASGANQQQEGTADMSGENNQSQTPPEEDAGGELNANGAGANAAAAPRTLEEHLTTLPKELADVLREGIETRANKRKSLVSTIVANSNGAYTEEMLQDTERYTLDELTRLETLSRPKNDYSGRPLPSSRTNRDLGENQNEPPAPPKAFQKKDVVRGNRVTDAPAEATV